MKKSLIVLFILLSFFSFSQEEKDIQIQLKKFVSFIREANAEMKMNNLERAIEFAEKAKETADKHLPNRKYVLQALYKLHFLYRISKQDEKLSSVFIELNTQRKKQLEEESKSFNESMDHLSRFYKEVRNPIDVLPTFRVTNDKVLTSLEQTFKTRYTNEKIDFIQNNVYKYIDLYQSFAYNTNFRFKPFNKIILDNALTIKGAVLNSSKDIIYDLKGLHDNAINSKIDDYRNSKELFIKQELLNKGSDDPEYIICKSNLDKLESELIQLHSKQFKDRKSSFRKMMMSGKLKLGEMAIEFSRFNLFTPEKGWTGETKYIAYLYKRGRTSPEVVKLFDEKELIEKLNNYYSSNIIMSRGAKGKSTSKNSDIDNLYQLIWKPLEEKLKGIKTIYYSADGLLNKVSFAALKGDSKKYLCEQFNLNQVSSTSTIGTTNLPDLNSVKLMGNINYTSNSSNLPNEFWKELPGTKIEIESIKNILPQAEVLMGDNANEESFKQLESNSFSVVHIATHGFYYNKVNSQESSLVFKTSKNPLVRSGLLFAHANNTWSKGIDSVQKEDGVLTALEISNMDLSSTDLIVLSACETALGDIDGAEGVYGLQRAFKMAGVKAMIMSLWEVPDTETAEFMQLFYSNWLGGQKIREAFRNTQIKMSTKYKDYPEKWAAFVLVE